jgi:hypothetical protein
MALFQLWSDDPAEVDLLSAPEQAVSSPAHPPRRRRARVRLHERREQALEKAGTSGWTVVSVKNDWATVF